MSVERLDSQFKISVSTVVQNSQDAFFSTQKIQFGESKHKLISSQFAQRYIFHTTTKHKSWRYGIN